MHHKGNLFFLLCLQSLFFLEREGDAYFSNKLQLFLSWADLYLLSNICNTAWNLFAAGLYACQESRKENKSIQPMFAEGLICFSAAEAWRLSGALELIKLSRVERGTEPVCVCTPAQFTITTSGIIPWISMETVVGMTPEGWILVTLKITRTHTHTHIQFHWEWVR